MRTHFCLTCQSCAVSIPDYRMTVPAPGVPNQMRKRHREANPDCPDVDDPPLCLTLVEAPSQGAEEKLAGLPDELREGMLANMKKRE